MLETSRNRNRGFLRQLAPFAWLLILAALTLTASISNARTDSARGGDIRGAHPSETTLVPVGSHANNPASIEIGSTASDQGQHADGSPTDASFFVLQYTTTHVSYLPMVEMSLSGEGLNVGMVSNVDGMDDAGFNENTWLGLQRAQTELGVQAQFIESQAEEDYEENIAELAQQNYDLIVTVGFAMGVATTTIAGAYPDVNFAIIDYGYNPLPNVLGTVFSVDEAAFPIGYLAAGWASMMDTGDPQVGWIGGMQIPPIEQYVVAYEAGVAYYNQQKGANVQVKGVYVGTFDAPDVGKAYGRSLIDEGVDVIFGVAGATGDGALEAARESGKWGIGSEVDQYYTLPNEKDTLITSCMKRVNNAAFSVVQQTVEGSFQGGGLYIGTLENEGVGLAPYHEFEDEIPVQLKQEVLTIIAGIIAGEIDTGW